MEPDDLIDLQEPTSYLAGDVGRAPLGGGDVGEWC